MSANPAPKRIEPDRVDVNNCRQPNLRVLVLTLLRVHSLTSVASDVITSSITQNLPL